MMLEMCDLTLNYESEDYQQYLKTLAKRLNLLEQTIIEKKVPVVIALEGFGAAGKGGVIKQLIAALDPRYFKVYSTKPPTEDERRYPFLKRFFEKTPVRGKISIFDRSWYYDLYLPAADGKLKNKKWQRIVREINVFERQLYDDGAAVIKLFLHISKEEQKQRFKALEQSPDTRWRVTAEDWKHNKQYADYYDAFDNMLAATNNDFAPWHIIPSTNRRYAVVTAYETVIRALETAAARADCRADEPVLPIRTADDIAPLPIPKLSEVDLNKTLSKDEYKILLKDRQQKLFSLHNTLYKKRIPLILAYEGWDAAGKGGNIKRMTSALDPRGYEVVSIEAPTPLEKAHHHLWRFWTQIPKDGHIAIYDRTWYGRVMVERFEGYCSENDWHRAYEELNQFEKSLSEWGAIIVKFWIHIDKETQLARFTDRQNTPEKQWKITDEDWRNRDKWDLYEQGANDMLSRTNTEYAPWIIVESNDKLYARIRAMDAVIAEIEKRLK